MSHAHLQKIGGGKTEDKHKFSSIASGSATIHFKRGTEKTARKRMLYYKPHSGFSLTSLGRKKARELMRKHRIVETLLCRFLGYTARCACRNASKLDLYLSTKLARDLCQKLNHPKICPCGKPIAGGKKCEKG